MTALSGEELMAWVEKTSERWLALLGQHPEALAIECDIMGTGMVAKLLQHVDRRLAELTISERSTEKSCGDRKRTSSSHSGSITNYSHRSSNTSRRLTSSSFRMGLFI